MIDGHPSVTGTTSDSVHRALPGVSPVAVLASQVPVGWRSFIDLAARVP